MRAVILLLFLPVAADARSGLCLLNCSTPVTHATPGNMLIGDANGDWIQQPFPGAASFFMTGHPELSGSLLFGAPGTLYFTETSTSSDETAVVKFVPVAGTFDNFCCQCDTAPGGSGRTFTFRKGATVAGMADSSMNVSFSSAQSGRRCDTTTDSASVVAGDFISIRTTNPSLGNDGRCGCSARLRIP